jgi:hypothetical protein
MKTKPGVKIQLGDAEARGTKFQNSKGFDPGVRKLGPDSQPGPNPGSPGAPLYNSKTVDDYTAKQTLYHAGHGPTPGLLNDLPKVGGGVGFEPYTSKSETADSPVRKQGRELPDPKIVTKADEARIAEAQIGNEPSGTLKD